jgi:hypothetical protein
MTKTEKIQLKIFLFLFLIKNCNLLRVSLGLLKGCPSYRRGPQKKTPCTAKDDILRYTGIGIIADSAAAIVSELQPSTT